MWTTAWNSTKAALPTIAAVAAGTVLGQWIAKKVLPKNN